MIVCIICGKEKDDSEFPFRSKKDGTRQTRCKQCQREYSKRHYAENKEKHNKRRYAHAKKKRMVLRRKILEHFSSNPCVDCGEADPVVLDFDHVRGDKKSEVSDLVRRCYDWSVIRDEIKKCDVRCANCHRRKTAMEQRWYHLIRD